MKKGDEEDDNGDVDNATSDGAHPTPEKENQNQKGWFLFWLSLSFITLPFVTVP